MKADAESFFANYPADAIENFPQLLERAKEEGYAEVLLTGTNVANASYQKGQISENGMIEPYVRLEFDSEGQELFAQGTEKYLNKYIAIMLDDSVCSMPGVNSVITEGTAMITGMENDDEARNLAADIVGAR